MLPPVNVFILPFVIQLHLINWLQVDVYCPAAEPPSVDSIQLFITSFRVFISAFVS